MKFNIDFKGILAPFYALKYWFKHPKTIQYPYEKKFIPDSYRGIHQNDLIKCIGCAKCQDICMNEAIDMILPPEDTKLNDKNMCDLIPRIDYGRCCWCALCADICPTDSLTLEKEFVYVSEDANAFLYTPGVDKL